MKTPITDDAANDSIVKVYETSKRLEIDRAALMEALEDLIDSPQPDEREGEFGRGTTPRKRAAAALTTARANFPQP